MIIVVKILNVRSILKCIFVYILGRNFIIVVNVWFDFFKEVIYGFICLSINKLFLSYKIFYV